jgi:hypothetical protein
VAGGAAVPGDGLRLIRKQAGAVTLVNLTSLSIGEREVFFPFLDGRGQAEGGDIPVQGIKQKQLLNLNGYTYLQNGGGVEIVFNRSG